jgi:hypothetical protein
MTFCVLFTLINSGLCPKNHKNFHEPALLWPILQQSSRLSLVLCFSVYLKCRGMAPPTLSPFEAMYNHIKHADHSSLYSRHLHLHHLKAGADQSIIERMVIGRSRNYSFKGSRGTRIP